MRIYVDTSVYGGKFDEEFKKVSEIFFNQVKTGQFKLVTSALVQEEMVQAPQEVRELFDSMLSETEFIQITDQALSLREAYLRGKIVSSKYSDDALHVALATISDCSSIVSWNFKHIVHAQKIPLYNAVNLLNGFKQIAIYSPMEVIAYD